LSYGKTIIGVFDQGVGWEALDTVRPGSTIAGKDGAIVSGGMRGFADKK
jgi:hypothetical protein